MKLKAESLTCGPLGADAMVSSGRIVQPCDHGRSSHLSAAEPQFKPEFDACAERASELGIAVKDVLNAALPAAHAALGVAGQD